MTQEDDIALVKASVREILPGWGRAHDIRGAENVCGRQITDNEPLIVELTPAGWLILGVDPYGRIHSGCRLDVISLAHDLRAISEGMHNPLSLGHVIPPVIPRVDFAPDTLQAESAAPSQPSPPGEANSEPQAQHTEESAAVPVEPAGPSPASIHGGMALSEDEISRRRAALMTEVDEYAEQLIAQHDPLDPEEIKRAIDLNNLLLLGLITDEQRAEQEKLNAAVEWRESVRRHATYMKSDVAEAEPDYLEIFDVEYGWPDPPA